MPVESLDYVALELHGDRPRKLFFGIDEIKALQKRVGQPLTVVGGQLALGNAEVTEHCLYIGLRRDDPKLKPETVTELIRGHCKGGGDLPEINTKIAEAFEAGGMTARKKKRTLAQLRAWRDELAAGLREVDEEITRAEAAEEAASPEDPPPTS